MDAAKAREHIEMVQQILAESSQRLCYGGPYFIIWGLYSGAATVSWQLIHDRVLPVSSVWFQIALLVAAIAVTVVRARMRPPDEERRSLVQREFFNVLWLTIGLSFIVNVGAFNLFPGFASAAIWSFAEAIVLLYIGMHGNRRAQIAGVAVVVSMIVANFLPNLAGYVLAAGMVAGYAGFGLAESLARE
jgi:hypothetical protein